MHTTDDAGEGAERRGRQTRYDDGCHNDLRDYRWSERGLGGRWEMQPGPVVGRHGSLDVGLLMLLAGVRKLDVPRTRRQSRSAWAACGEVHRRRCFAS